VPESTSSSPRRRSTRPRSRRPSWPSAARLAECATALAEAKASRVARRHPGSLVIGADQLLVCEGVWFDKPADLAAARRAASRLARKRHELVSALCVVRDGETLWHFVDRSSLTCEISPTLFSTTISPPSPFPRGTTSTVARRRRPQYQFTSSDGVGVCAQCGFSSPA